jgi:hypothetical protein
MLTVLASILLAATVPATDFSANCLIELGYDAIPKNGAQLFLYRRCLNTNKKKVDLEKKAEANLQRLDQNFWMRKDAADKRKEASIKQSANALKSSQKKRALAIPSLQDRRAIIQNAARSRSRAMRLQEKTGD